MTDPAAEEIADELLYKTGRAISNGEFDHFKVHFELPQIVETHDKNEVIRSEEELRVVFEKVQRHLRENDIAQIVRSVVSSEFLDADTIGSTHVSRTFRHDGTPLGKPYPTYSVLRRTEDCWKVVRTCVALCENPEHTRMFSDDQEPTRPKA